MSEKLQKVLAAQGLGSRREIERWIQAGRLRINGQLAKLGDRVTEDDTVHLDGKKLRSVAAKKVRVLLYNKPEGEICTRSDPEGRQTVFQSLPPLTGERWVSIGRLDINSCGLLLFTNHGELANRLMHPSSNIDREYSVRVHGAVDDQMQERLKEGVVLEDGVARFSDIVAGEQKGTNRWFTVALMEGKNREVRRLFESQDVEVNRLKRVRFGPIFLPSFLRAGQYLELEHKQVADLFWQAGLDAPDTYRPAPKEREKRERHMKKLRSSAGRTRPRNK